MRGALRREQAEEAPGDITPFQALATAMAAIIGNGNIAGVATAIAIGGPGAAFWMAAMAPLGMATNFAEVFLAVKYRRQNHDQTVLGGPMLYLDKGVGVPGLGWLFAFGATVGALGAGNLAQANSVALVMFTQFGLLKWTSGFLIATILAAVIIGGIKRIAQVAERLVPTMVVLYVFSVILILLMNFQALPQAIRLIITSAFSPIAAVGGFTGATLARTIEYGIRRGAISSEAGLGSAGIAHSAARTSDPMRQGIIAMMGVFIDNLIVCMATALTIVVTGVWSNGEMSTALVASAFNANIPYGGAIVAICSALFGFTTMVAWAYYGEQGLRYLVGKPHLGIPYRLVYCVLAFVGSIYGVKVIWDFSDFLIGLMMLPNVIGLVVLSRAIKTATKHFNTRSRSNE
jgi:AGCS family alanine or glycine:cation symporter